MTMFSELYVSNISPQKKKTLLEFRGEREVYVLNCVISR